MLIHQPNHFCERWLPLIIEQAQKRFAFFKTTRQLHNVLFWNPGLWICLRCTTDCQFCKTTPLNVCDCFLHVFLMFKLQEGSKNRQKISLKTPKGWAKSKESNCTFPGPSHQGSTHGFSVLSHVNMGLISTQPKLFPLTEAQLFNTITLPSTSHRGSSTFSTAAQTIGVL